MVTVTREVRANTVALTEVDIMLTVTAKFTVVVTAAVMAVMEAVTDHEVMAGQEVPIMD